MNTDYPPLRDILPHGESIIFLDAILSHDSERSTCRAVLRDHPDLVVDGVISPWVGLECLGQGACVHTVLEGAPGGSEGGLGVLIGVRELTIHVDALDPEVSLIVDVEGLLTQGSLQSAHGILRTEEASEVLLEGRLNAYLPDDPDAFLEDDVP